MKKKKKKEKNEIIPSSHNIQAFYNPTQFQFQRAMYKKHAGYKSIKNGSFRATVCLLSPSNNDDDQIIFK
jgi:hypothetical protein